VAGRIREDDIALVRERARIDEVVSSYVTLRHAGGGSQKGLCPFHDEKSPSFHVTPSRNVFYCFGCGEGGDVISFLQKIDGLGFTDAVERLADKCGVQLRYEELPGGGAPGPRRDANLRPRLIEAHKAAAAFYADHLGSPDGLAGRQFLSERGFDKAAADTFGIGFAPRDGDALYRHLRQKGFRDEELVTGGLVAQGRSGHYDRFRGRLVWPIRDVSGDVIGFGARRLFDDDRIDAKYLNTPETPIYKKSQVLYGIDLARREMARSSQAVVVEGYTDVMACHLSGVGTAVATCGTAFGEDHARVVRRLLRDHEEFRGEIIFTFDGDEAGQRAALRAFNGDAQFVGQTYVAVEPGGLDPCDLRLSHGDAAVRELVARRIPLYRFVLKNVINQFDLDRADARAAAVREAAKLVSSSRDSAVRNSAFARELAQLVGMDPDDVLVEVRRATARARRGQQDAGPPGQHGRPGGRGPGTTGGGPGRKGEPGPDAPQRPAAPPLPDLRDPRFSLERETLKLVVQHPQVVGSAARDVTADDFIHPTYRAVWDAVAEAGGPTSAPAGEAWVGGLRAAVQHDPPAHQALHALAVEPLLSSKDPDAGYVAAHVHRLQELTAMRRIAEVKSRLQRTNPVEQATDYNRMFGELVALEQHRRNLREAALGGEA
jgi:DNA primase